VSDVIIKMSNLTKTFPGVIALSDVNLSMIEGSIHGLVGENGAGKSTLIKILSGIYTEYEGKIFLQNKNIQINSPSHAQKLGITTIFQELTVVLGMSVMENIFLGREKLKFGGFMDRNYMFRKSKEILNFLESSINPKNIAGNLSIANQQVIEICKALVLDAKLIIMDEPTASLTRIEVYNLFELIKKLRDSGKTIIFVTHKIDEIFEVCDRISVLRDGKIVGNLKKEKTSHGAVVKMMIGHEVVEVSKITKRKMPKKLLEISQLNKEGEYENINLDLYEGEIIGLAGLIGAGRTELSKSIIGLSIPNSGKIKVQGKEHKFFNHPRNALSSGIAYLPEDRKNEAIFPELSVSSNISISILRKCSSLSFIINKKIENKIVNKYIKDLRIKIINKKQLMKNLSGGNQQKAIIGRLLSTNSKIFIFDEATRGVDIGSKFEIYEIIKKITDAGYGIVFISSEIPELLIVCDRIILMRGGKFVKEFKKEDKPSEESIMKILTRSNNKDDN